MNFDCRSGRAKPSPLPPSSGQPSAAAFWTEVIALLIFLGAMSLIGAQDYEAAEVTARIVAANPKPITHYMIRQDSQGYEPSPLPFTHPLEDK